MAPIQDVWYVRLPNGRVIRSRNTVSLRYHVRKGRIPAASRVRRSPTEAWRQLADVQELAEAAEVATVRGSRRKAFGNGQPRRRDRADFREWRTLGMRGLARELADALDSTLQRSKLGVACLLGVLGGVALIFWRLMEATLDGAWWVAGASSGAVAMLLIVSIGISWVTQYTSVELARMRAPRAGELWPSVLGHGVRLATALLIVVGAGALLVWLMRGLPEWITAQRGDESAWWDYAAVAALVVRLILEVVFWPFVALAPLLLSPILVVQECSVGRGIVEWWRLLRGHLGRIFLYEAMATTLAAIFTIPLLIPIALAWSSLGAMNDLALEAGAATLSILSSLALTPLIAYLLVANVFIYLNLRYEFFHSER